MKRFIVIVFVGFFLGLHTGFANDYAQAAKELVEKCMESVDVNNYLQENEKPVVIVEPFTKDYTISIDTASLTKEFETAFKKYKQIDLVAGSLERNRVRQEREEQQIWASEETAKRLANETGADLMLIGSIKPENNNSAKNCRLYVELIHIESTKTLWMDNIKIKNKSPSQPAIRKLSLSSFLNSQEDAPMGGIFIGGGNLLQAKEMKERHNLSVGFLLPSFWLGDWGNVFYWGGRVEIQGSILGEKTMDFTFLSGITLTLWRFQPYIEGGFGLRNGNWKPTLEVSPGIDFSFTKQSPIAFGVFYRFQWHSDWEHITGKDEYLGARILIRPQNFFTMQLPDFSGKHVISLGYIFPTNLTTAETTGFSAGSKDNFGVSVSWEDSDHKQFPCILALSYRRSQVQEEGSSHQTVAHSSTNQESVQTRTHHILMLEGSLGWQLIPGLVFYGGGGIGLSLVPENNMAKGDEGHFSREFDWQLQGGVRVKLFDLLYTRTQIVYLHTGEVNLSVHLGLALF